METGTEVLVFLHPGHAPQSHTPRVLLFSVTTVTQQQQTAETNGLAPRLWPRWLHEHPQAASLPGSRCLGLWDMEKDAHDEVAPGSTPPNTRQGDSSGEGRTDSTPEAGSVRCAVWGSGSPTQKPLKGHGRDEVVSVEREYTPRLRAPQCLVLCEPAEGAASQSQGPGAMLARPPKELRARTAHRWGRPPLPNPTRTAPHQDLEGLAHRCHSSSPHRPPPPRKTLSETQLWPLAPLPFLSSGPSRGAMCCPTT